MNRTEKEELVESLRQSLNKAGVILVTHNAGLTVAEVTDLRKIVRKSGATYKVAKNRLACIALEGTKFEAAKSIFKGPTALICAEEPIAVAKAIIGYATSNPKLKIVGGCLDGQLLDEKAIKTLSTLPSLNELRARILGMLQTPATRLATVLQAPASQVARVVQAYSKKEQAA